MTDKLIPLTQGKFAVVDESDYQWLSRWKWYARKHNGTFYAGRVEPSPSGKRRQKEIHMHRQIMQVPEGLFIDHMDHDGLNNRRSNLRLCTIGENNCNKNVSRNNHSGFVGVGRCANGKWRARVKINGVSYSAGSSFDSPLKAAIARNSLAVKLHGPFATSTIGEA